MIQLRYRNVEIRGISLRNLADYIPLVLTTSYISYTILTTFLKEIFTYSCPSMYLYIYSSAISTLLLAISIILGVSVSGLYLDYLWRTGKGLRTLVILLLSSSILFTTYVVTTRGLSQEMFISTNAVFWFIIGFLLGNLLTNTSLYTRYGYDVMKRGTAVGVGVGLGALFHLGLAASGLNVALLIITCLTLSILSATSLLAREKLHSGKYPERVVNEGVSLYDTRVLMFLIPIYIFSLMHGLIIRSHILPHARVLLADVVLNEIVMNLPMLMSVLAGMVMDSFGRKVVGIAGLIVLGITSVFMLTIYTLIIPPIEISVLTLIFSRLSAALIAPYIMILSAEIAPKKFAGKFLSICYGTTAAGVLTGIITPDILKSFYLPTAIGAMILFTSVYILYILPETLPPEYLRRKEIISYVKKAMKLKDKSRSS
ncbi:MAG: hypothetical protein J7J11_00470 [Desulfurococcales archaeon]|nr:hypothetical protein [Desulfurococcales archaeon]